MKSYQLARLKYGPTDIRFTTKGDTLYATALGWPADGQLTIAALGTNSPDYSGRIGKVELLGYPSALEWTRSPAGLQIRVPSAPPGKYAHSFRILPA